MRIIKTEFKKMFRKPWNLIVYLTSLILALGIIPGMNSVENTAKHYISPDYRIDMAKEKISYLYGEIMKINSDQNKTKSQKDQLITEIKDNISWKEKEIVFARVSMDSGTYPEEEKNRINNWEIESLAKLEKENPKLKDMFLSQRLAITEVKEKGYYLDTLSYSSAQTYALNFINVMSVFAFSFLTLILGGDMIGGEYTDNKIVRLSRLPYSKGRIYFGKVLSLFFYSFIIYFGAGLIGFIYTLITKGYGPADFPMLFAEKLQLVDYNGFAIVFPNPTNLKMIPASSFTLQAVLLQVLFLFTMCAFMVFLSTLTRKPALTALAFFIIFMIMNTLANVAPKVSQKASHLIFLTYSNTHKVLDGSQGKLFLNQNVTFNMGIIVNIASAVIFILLGYYLFNKNGLSNKPIKVEAPTNGNEKERRIITAAD